MLFAARWEKNVRSFFGLALRREVKHRLMLARLAGRRDRPDAILTHVGERHRLDDPKPPNFFLKIFRTFLPLECCPRPGRRVA